MRGIKVSVVFCCLNMKIAAYILKLRNMYTQLHMLATGASYFYNNKAFNEEQIITGYPIDGAMGSLGGRHVQKLSVVCLHNAIVATGILVTILHCGTRSPPQRHLYCLFCWNFIVFSLCKVKNDSYKLSSFIFSHQL